MKRKLFLALGLLLSASFVKGQWQGEVAAKSWNYNFSSGTAATFNISGGDNLSSSGSPFLPAPPSGTSRVYVPASSGSSFTLDPVANKLTMVAASSGSSKFSAFTVANATEIVRTSFNINFGKTGATNPTNNTAFVWSIGFRGENSNLYSNNNAVFTSLNSDGNLFNAIRFLFNGTNLNYVVGYRTVGTTTTGTYATLSGGALSQDVPYRVEVYCNNSSVTKAYTRGVTVYDVAAGSFQLWITNLNTSAAVRYSVSAGVFDIPKSVETNTSTGDLSIPVNTALNAFLLQGSANPSNFAKVVIDGGITLDYNLSTLPVSLTSFTGENTASGILLNWKTASEKSNSHFEIFRAGEDKDFKFVSRINGKGNSDAIQNYSYTDNNPLNGNNYYQLKQVDFDGTETIYNQLVAVKSSLNNQNFKVYVNEEGLLNAYINASSSTIAKITVYDISGKKVFESNQNLQAGDNAIKIAIPTIQAGVYVARITANGLNAQTKFVKK